MIDNNRLQEKPRGFELIELLFGKLDPSISPDSLDKSFETRFQSLVDQIQCYLHSVEKAGFFPHRFLGWFSSVLDTKLNDKLDIKKLHFRFQEARTIKVVAQTESQTHVFIFTENIEAQHAKSSDVHISNFEFTTGEFKSVMGKDYNELDSRKLQIDVIKILKDQYELVKTKPKLDKGVRAKKLYLYLKNDVLEYKAMSVNGNIQTMRINPNELKGNSEFKNNFFDEIKQFLDKSGKDLSDDVKNELSRLTSEKGYTLKNDGENEKINIKVEMNKKIKDVPIPPPTEFPFTEVKKRLDKSVHLESYIEKLANPDAEIDQVLGNLEQILTYIKEVHTNLNLQSNVYGVKAREADQHGFVVGIFDNFRYRDNTKIYLEQFAGGGYADVILLVRGPSRAGDSVPILIELKAGTVGKVTPNDALKQAEDYVKGFRPNKMRILSNAGNVIAVGLNLDSNEPFKTAVKPIKQPPAPLMEEFIELVDKWDNQLAYEEVFKREIKDLLSSEYHTFPANKETKDHYYFSRDILGQSILINKIGQDQGNVKKYIYSYGEYPLDWPAGTEYTLSKSPVMTLIFVQGNEGQEKTAFIFHIRESNTKKFYVDKKIPVLNIPEIGGVEIVIEIKMCLKKYETGLSFEDLFEIVQISKYTPSDADQQFTGSFLKIPNSDELKAKLDQAITSQHATSSKNEVTMQPYKKAKLDQAITFQHATSSKKEVILQAYKLFLTDVADAIYLIKDLITNEARLQAFLNGLFISYSDFRLQETSAQTVIIPEFQIGAGGRVDMVIQSIGTSPQDTKEDAPIALEFKLINENLDEERMKKVVDKLTKDQNVRYAKGAALKTITDSDKMFFMGVVVNIKAQEKDYLILMSDEIISAKVSHSSIEFVEDFNDTDTDSLESATKQKNYSYWLQQHDIAKLAKVVYGYTADGVHELFEIVGSPEHITSQLQQFQNALKARDERRPLILIVNLDNNHWVTLVISHQNGRYIGYYADSLGNTIPDNILQVLQRDQITVNDVSVAQQTDDHNCGLWALENAKDIYMVLQSSRQNVLDEIRKYLQVRGRNEDSFMVLRENFSNILTRDPRRKDKLEAVLSETEHTEFNLNNCLVPGGRSKRSINPCLFSKVDVEKFSKGKVDGNNVDKVIIDSEKFLTYVKSSQDEGKNAQLVKFVRDKSMEGNYRYLVDRVIHDQGYVRYIQNERIRDLYGDISQEDFSSIKSSKLKSRLINAVGTIQLIRGIHATIVSCADGESIDCGLSVSGMAWSFASQPIENVIVKAAPKMLKSAGQLVGNMIPGTLGRQAQFAVAFAGVNIGGKIAKSVAGALGGVFDIVDIGMSASSLVDCKNRENSDSPCVEKKIRDNIASISFSGMSFISGVAFSAAGIPVVGVAVGFVLMVGQGVYSGVSNILEYEERYDTTHDENWRIFWHTFAFQPIPLDVQHLVQRTDIVNSQTQAAWKILNDSPSDVVACAIGLGVDGYTPSLLSTYGKILMNRADADTENFSRVIPKPIQNAAMICLPQSIGKFFEKGIRQSVPTAVHYCENTIVIADKRRMQNGTTILYNLEHINIGTIFGSSKLMNYFLVFTGNTTITGGDNTVNRFTFLKNRAFFGNIRGGYNATNIIDLSQSMNQDSVVEVKANYNLLLPGTLTFRLAVNLNELIYDYIDRNADTLKYIYLGRVRKPDNVECTYNFQRTTADHNCNIFIDSGGGLSKDEIDTVDNCLNVAILPYTKITGAESDYTFYVKTTGYRAKDLYSEIDVEGNGTIIFPKISLLNDCSEIAYSSINNTLSLKIELGQGDQYALVIRNYIEQISDRAKFVLVDKNGNNIIPKIKKLKSSYTKIDSFELHAEHSLDSLDAVENHYKKIIMNNQGYKVFGVVRGKLQSQSNSTLQHIVFGSLEGDVINLDQGSMFAIGGNGSDIYVIDNNTEKREIIIDNNSDDKLLDVLMMPRVSEKFFVQQCDLHLSSNSTHIQVRNYFKDIAYRHLVVMSSSKRETFIPYVGSMSCASAGSPIENGKLVPFFHATPTQNVFLLSKDFRDNHVVIDSLLEEIERYKDKDDLLLVREGEIPFIIKIEDFYKDRRKWEDVNFLLWNNGNFSPYSEFYQEVNGVMDYQDKLKDDYEKTIKEYFIDFTQSVSITHNQDDTLTSVEEDEKRIGVIILKNITPGRIQVFSSDRNLVFSDKASNHVVNIKNWNNSESYRVSTLEFDLGLEPIIIPKLEEFSLSSIAQIQNLIDKATGICQMRDDLELGKQLPIAVQDDDFRKVKVLLNQCASINAKDKYGLTPLHYAAANGNLGVVEYMVEKGADLNIQCYRLRTPLHLAAMYGYLEVVKYLKERGAALNVKDHYGRSPLLYATINSKSEVVQYLVEEGANINDKDQSNRTPLDFAIRNGYKDIIEFLKQSRLDLSSKYQNAINEGNLDIAKSLVDKGDYIDETNESGQTILHLAAGDDDLELVKHLLENGAKVNTIDSVGETPLHYAVTEGDNLEIVRLLVEKGADVNAMNIFGRIPLHLAIIVNRLELVEYFVKRGADFNLSDIYGDTPLCLATKKGYSDIIRYLKKNLDETRGGPKQRKRRHHHGDQNSHHLSHKSFAIDLRIQPEIVTSSGTRPPSWMNSCIFWAKNLAANTFSITPGLPTQFNVASKSDDINKKSEGNNTPKSISAIGLNNFLNSENIAFAGCVANALDNTPSTRYQNLVNKGIKVLPSKKVAVEFALREFDSFVEGKIRNLDLKERTRIRAELKDAYPKITASLERGVEFSGNVGLGNVLEKVKKCFCSNVLPKNKVSTCLSDVGVTMLGNNLSN